jgi:hypothetical protein
LVDGVDILSVRMQYATRVIPERARLRLGLAAR